MIKFLAALPSTNARVFVTLLVFIATAGRYLLSDVSAIGFTFKPWDPSWDWLLFIAAMSGLDLATFAAKRKTDADYIAAVNAGKPTTIAADQANVTGQNVAVTATDVLPPTQG